MTETKHTPGPWSYSPPFDDGSMLRSSWQPAIIGRFEPASDGTKYRRLAEICAFEFRMTPSEADGRLMAAAPELLEALKKLYALVEGECPSLLDEDSGGDSRLDIEIRAAIAKAKGEDHG